MFCGNKPSYGNNSAYVTVFSKLKRMEEIRKALAEDLLALEKKNSFSESFSKIPTATVFYL